MMRNVNCLRCPGQPLAPDPAVAEGEVTGYRCERCGRAYAARAGAPLTYRWGHPVSLILYGFDFRPRGLGDDDDDKLTRIHATHTARSLATTYDAAERAALIDEAELELDDPTQPIRDILGTDASEAECRAYVRLVVEAMRRLRPRDR